MTDNELIQTATIRENLSLPLVFKSIDKSIRDNVIETLLDSKGLSLIIEKHPRYLSDDEYNKILDIKKELSSKHSNLEIFLKLLETSREARSCLPLIQGEIFADISSTLRVAASQLERNQITQVVDELEDVLDKLALRILLSTYIPIPGKRVLEVSQLVIRNYRDILKYKNKVSVQVKNKVEKEIVKHLHALSDSFSEIGKNTK